MGVSAGRVLLIPKGDWNAETTYTGLDCVRHNGATWVCKNTCTDIEPTEANSDNWQILARDGKKGAETIVDAAISDTSENPVQNKVIKKYVDEHVPEIDDMTGATATQNGGHGLVPAPQMGDEKKALLGNGTWGNVDAIFTYKTKEEYDAAVANDEIPDGATVIKEYDEEGQLYITDVDTAMSDTSTSPVQNKVINKYVDDLSGSLQEIELTRNNIEGIDTTNTQCFVKNGIVYAYIAIVCDANKAIAEWTKIIGNLPIPVYNSPLFIYSKALDGKILSSMINKDGELMFMGSTLQSGNEILEVISYPIA